MSNMLDHRLGSIFCFFLLYHTTRFFTNRCDTYHAIRAAQLDLQQQSLHKLLYPQLDNVRGKIPLLGDRA